MFPLVVGMADPITHLLGLAANFTHSHFYLPSFCKLSKKTSSIICPARQTASSTILDNFNIANGFTDLISGIYHHSHRLFRGKAFSMHLQTLDLVERLSSQITFATMGTTNDRDILN